MSESDIVISTSTRHIDITKQALFPLLLPYLSSPPTNYNRSRYVAIFLTNPGHRKPISIAFSYDPRDDDSVAMACPATGPMVPSYHRVLLKQKAPSNRASPRQ